jgi:hypothetical protein
MKLATLRNGGRDGRLVVVSRRLTRAADARRPAAILQTALDDWARRAAARGARPRGPFIQPATFRLKPETLSI